MVQIYEKHRLSRKEKRTFKKEMLALFLVVVALIIIEVLIHGIAGALASILKN